jgi:hypothetical protein
MSVETLKQLIIHNLDVTEFMDLLGMELADIIDRFDDEIEENFELLLRSVE